MKKIGFFIIIILFVTFGTYANTSYITLRGNIPEKGNQSLKLGYGKEASSLTGYVGEGVVDKIDSNIDLSKDGEYYFSIYTDMLVNFSSDQPETIIEVITGPFILDSMTIQNATERQKVDFLEGNRPTLQKNELDSSNPFINIDTSCYGNKLSFTYKKGITYGNIALANFKISWKGKENLQAGKYKALISVVYVTK